MEPTKICRKCGNEFVYEFLCKNKECKGGVEALCKECYNANKRKRRKENHEYYIKQTREYYNKNKERLNANARRYKSSHREQVRAAGRLYWKLRPEKHAENTREWRKNNPKKAMQRTLRWQKRNPEKVKQYKHISEQKRLAKHRNLPRTLTVKEWDDCKSFFNNKCAYCGKEEKLTVDHYIPLANEKCLGTVIENVVPACISCNSSKHKKDAVEWINEKNDLHTAQHILSRINSYFYSVLGIGKWD